MSLSPQQSKNEPAPAVPLRAPPVASSCTAAVPSRLDPTRPHFALCCNSPVPPLW